MKFLFKENKDTKQVISKEYNYLFNKKTGFFARWGKTKEDDPDFSFLGPEIADIEISTICNGINGTPCKFCYKSNTGKGENMSLETFKRLFSHLPKVLTQIAFGIGSINSNPDLFKIMEYCRTNDYNEVIPNITINGDNLTDEYADKLVELSGAIAVSRYEPKDVCYNAVKKLTDRGLSQVNIHMLVSEETHKDCLEVIEDAKSDPRLEKLNAIVFLSMKPKGNRNKFHCLKDPEKYKEIIELAFKNEVGIGFDSCSAPKFLEAVKDKDNYKQLETLAEPCESTIFSIYINHKGEMVPCSFLEGESFEPINVLETKDFLEDIWYNKRTREFRSKLSKNVDCRNCRKCPVFDIY